MHFLMLLQLQIVKIKNNYNEYCCCWLQYCVYSRGSIVGKKQKQQTKTKTQTEQKRGSNYKIAAKSAAKNRRHQSRVKSSRDAIGGEWQRRCWHCKCHLSCPQAATPCRRPPPSTPIPSPSNELSASANGFATLCQMQRLA